MGAVKPDYPLLAIIGPTAAGKSALAIALALRWKGEILNCDSVQIYRGFDIGTGKVPPEKRRGIPHHLLDVADPGQTFTAGDYRRAAERVLEEVRGRGNLPILVGGTGFYLRALLLGLFEGPARSEDVRERLGRIAKRRGREFLHRILVRLDPTAAARIHSRDTPKLIRALEVCLLTRRPMTEMHGQGRRGLEGFRILKVGLDPPRDQLTARIARRTEEMFRGGLLDEVRDMLSRPGAEYLKPLGAIGYREAKAVLTGSMAEADAVRQVQIATRQYAKRQMTWFRRETDVEWFRGFGEDPLIERRISGWLQDRLSLGVNGRPDRSHAEGQGEI